MTDKDGGAAFYMTLRDKFAAAALTGMLSSPVNFSVDKDTKAVTPDHFAKLAWMYADGMLAARDPKPAETPTGEVPF